MIGEEVNKTKSLVMSQPAHTDVYEYNYDHLNSLTDIHSLDISALEIRNN